MNYDIIEGLTQDQINELFNEVIENPNNNSISYMYLYVKCTNGKRGTFYDSGYYLPSGECEFATNAEFASVCNGVPDCGSICHVCGNCYEYGYQCNGKKAW